MSAASSKYSVNQFELVTRRRNPLMAEILAFTRPRLISAVGREPAFAGDLARLEEFYLRWDDGASAVANGEALLGSQTMGLDGKLASLTRKPDPETNSPMESWLLIIRSTVAYRGTVYIGLLPQGRKTIAGDRIDPQLAALQAFAVRLAEQTTRPALVALAAVVATFAEEAKALRTAQMATKARLATARRALETLRLEAAAILIGMVGTGLQVWRGENARVDALFNVRLLRGGARRIPEPPADTLWVPDERRLSTTEMPRGATRLEAWRQGPGGMPEQLAIGEPDEMEVMIPARITFAAGAIYQLWLVAHNSRGSSEPGPVESWVAG